MLPDDAFMGTHYACERLNLQASDGLFLHIVRHIERGADGSHQAAGIGFARTGQAQGRAMIDGGADKGQAEGDIHAFAETGVFEHRQSLVVIHGEDGIGIFE